MYSELFIFKIKNPAGVFTEDYIVDYSGNKQPESIVKDIKAFTKKHGYFNSKEFDEEYLNDTSSIYYLQDIKSIIVKIPKEVWDIDALNIPF